MPCGHGVLCILLSGASPKNLRSVHYQISCPMALSIATTPLSVKSLSANYLGALVVVSVKHKLSTNSLVCIRRFTLIHSRWHVAMSVRTAALLLASCQGQLSTSNQLEKGVQKCAKCAQRRRTRAPSGSDSVGSHPTISAIEARIP